MDICKKFVVLWLVWMHRVWIFLSCEFTISVTLLLEMQQKEFTSDKPIYPLQFGTIIHIMGLSLTFKTIK